MPQKADDVLLILRSHLKSWMQRQAPERPALLRRDGKQMRDPNSTWWEEGTHSSKLPFDLQTQAHRGVLTQPPRVKKYTKPQQPLDAGQLTDTGSLRVFTLTLISSRSSGNSVGYRQLSQGQSQPWGELVVCDFLMIWGF